MKENSLQSIRTNSYFLLQSLEFSERKAGRSAKMDLCYGGCHNENTGLCSERQFIVQDEIQKRMSSWDIPVYTITFQVRQSEFFD